MRENHSNIESEQKTISTVNKSMFISMEAPYPPLLSQQNEVAALGSLQGRDGLGSVLSGTFYHNNA